MRKKQHHSLLTEVELEFMTVVWELEQGSVRDILAELNTVQERGMAATPKRASGAERALTGQPWSEAAFEAAAEALAQDFTPLDDWRASAAYRMLGAQNLLRRFFLEHDAATTAPIQLETA